MTTVGENRERYAAEMPSDPRPSRYREQGKPYAEWAARADAHAAMIAGFSGPDAAAMKHRDNAVCECGHKNVSHGYGGHLPESAHPRIGRGACGIDRDTRNYATGYVGDPCPCTAFKTTGEALAAKLVEGDRIRAAAATAASPRYATARAVVDTATAGMLEGALLDTFTASAMVAVYEGLSDANRAKFDTVPLDKLIAIVWKVIK